MEQAIPKRKANLGPALRVVEDARVRRSRADLRAALLDLLQARPFAEISIRDLTAASGVGYTTFFRHYPGKEALLDDLAADEIARMTELTVPVWDSADARAASVALCTYVDERRALWSALLTGGAAEVIRAELLAQGRASAATRATDRALPPDLGVALAAAVIFELLSWWLRQPEPWSIERVAETLDRTAISPSLDVERDEPGRP